MNDTTCRDLPFTLPSLTVVVLRLPVPISEEDYEALIGHLEGMRPALTAGRPRKPAPEEQP